MDTTKTNKTKNASSKNPTPPVALIEEVNAPSGADAFLFSSTETRTSGGKVNVPLGADALNPVGMGSDSSDMSAVSEALADDLPMTEVENKKKLKRQRQKLRKQLEKGMEGCSIAGEKGVTEGTPKAGTSGATSKPAKESHSSGEDSRKRGRTAGDTPDMVLKKRKLYSQAVKKAINLLVVCKEDSREITSLDADHITSVIDDRLLDGSISTCRVHRTSLQPNGLNILCEDQETVDVLKILINSLPAPSEDHPGYHAMAPGDRPPLKRFFAWFPGNRSPRDNFKLLGACNKGLDVKKITIKAVIPGDGGNTLVLGVDIDLMAYLEAHNFKLFCGARGSIQLKEQRHQKAAEAGKTMPVPEDPQVETQPMEKGESEKESEPEPSMEALGTATD